jgi:hypothetical protein
MKKVLLSAAALGLLSSVAIAEPLKLDDGTLGEVAGGFNDTNISAVSNTWTSNSFTTSTSSRTATQTATSMSSNDANAVAVGSSGVSATGSSSSMISFGGIM